MIVILVVQRFQLVGIFGGQRLGASFRRTAKGREPGPLPGGA